jgi:tellurite resistance protein TehA-like permease
VIGQTVDLDRLVAWRRGQNRAMGTGSRFRPLPPASGAVVMGSGIVSLVLSRDGHETLSRFVLAIAAGAWVAIALSLLAGGRADPGALRAQARSPAALTGVAGTAVLGTRVAALGWTGAAVALLLVATALWAVLLPPVLRHLELPTSGASFMVTVSTEAIAVLTATAAATTHARWLLAPSVVLLAAGLVLYVVVLRSFAFRELVVGAGDHWITGGALAICTLAAAQLATATGTLDVSPATSDVLRHASVVLWTGSMCWFPVLLAVEVARPRPRYDLRRWSTVFPLGMYAACSFAVGSTSDLHAVTRLAQAAGWLAFAAWLVVGIGTLRRIDRSRVHRHQLSSRGDGGLGRERRPHGSAQ